MKSKCSALLLAWFFLAGIALGQLDERIFIDVTINGKPARLVFDTGSTFPALLPKAVARLGLSATDPPKNAVPELGKVFVGETEQFDLVMGGIKNRTSFGVVKIPSMLNFDADGVIGWTPIRRNIVSINALSRTVEFLATVPKETATWTKLTLQTNSGIVRLEWTLQDGRLSSIIIDTGWPQGVKVAPEKWRDWKASHNNQPTTLLAYYEPSPGLLVAEEAWAKALSFGPLTITEVPIIEAHKTDVAADGPSYEATFGLWALKRMEIIIDGTQGTAYVRPRKTRPPLYGHNRLGAVFVPQDLQAGEDLIARVVPGSPASEAGIRDGDILLKIGELDVTKWRTDPTVLPLSRFWNRASGEKLDLTLKRGAERLKLSIVLREILSPETGSATKVSSGADEKPPKSAFANSQYDFTVAKFALLGAPHGESGYRTSPFENPPNQTKMPFRTMYWTNADDHVALDWMVLPDVLWKYGSPAQMFAGIKIGPLSTSKNRLLSERDYQIDGHDAHSFLYSVGDDPIFMRVDYFLAKPDMYALIFGSTNKAALDGAFCKDLFNGVSITPRNSKTENTEPRKLE